VSHKKITRIYTGDDGRSHFEDLIVPMNELIAGARISLRSALVPATGVSFRENPLGRSEEFHCPKQRQFVITLFGAVEISCAGGKRSFGPGDVLFAEDRTGEGHANRELLGPRQSLILPVPDDFDIRRWATAP
jgi:hypothetical protein